MVQQPSLIKFSCSSGSIFVISSAYVCRSCYKLFPLALKIGSTWIMHCMCCSKKEHPFTSINFLIELSGNIQPTFLQWGNFFANSSNLFLNFCIITEYFSFYSFLNLSSSPVFFLAFNKIFLPQNNV